MRGFKKILDLFSNNSRTHWWNNNCTRIDGARHDSLRLERVCASQGCSFKINSILENGLNAGGKQQGGTYREKSSEEAPSDDFTIPRKVHYHRSWKHDQDAVHWVKLSRAQDQGLRFWQTKSSAIIVRNPLLTDCICGAISQSGDRTLFERLSTARPAPKVTLGSNWQSQQQQPLSGGASSSSRKLDAVGTGNRDVKGNTTEDPGSSSFRKPVRNYVSPVDREPKFEIDLRVEGVPQDAIFGRR